MQTQILIVEDEDWAVENLSEQLVELLGDTIRLHITRTVRETVSFLKANVVDLVFMDIHLGDGMSFDVFKEVNITLPIIFTTAFDQYALEAFKHRGYAYILKPFQLSDLKGGLERVNFVFDKQDVMPYKARFLVRYGNKLKSIPTTEIAYFMADDKLVFANTFSGDSYVIDETIGTLTGRLAPETYFQINRKFIVHVSAIADMSKISRNRIKLKLSPPCKEEVIVSEERSVAFQQWLNV